jgi:uncharacterized protein (TIGR00369 family)
MGAMERKYTHTSAGCYGCGADNPQGLQLRPYHDGEWIAADYEAQARHRGFSRVVHGGVIAALLDEIVTCAASIAMSQLAATVKIEVEFLAPMLVGENYVIRARHLGPDGRAQLAEGAIVDAAGRTIARARGRFVPVPPDFLGTGSGVKT